MINGAVMGVGVVGSSDSGPEKVLRLCESYLRLNERRLTLDSEITATGVDAQERERLWLELESVLSESVEVLNELSAARSSEPAAVRAKASVLGLVLRSPRAEPLDATLAALALSVADDVAGLE